MSKPPHTGTAIRAELTRIIAREGEIAPERLIPEATLDTIGIASHDLVLVLMSIEETFDLYVAVDSDFADVETLDQLLGLLTSRIMEHQALAEPAASEAC